MGMTLTGLNKYTARLRSESKRIDVEGAKIAKASAEYGADLMRFYVQTAETETGRQRAERGGRGPGREETGTLLEAIKVGQPSKLTGGGIAITFGWMDVKKDYFYFQEIGARKIPPMFALMRALVHTREYFYARIKEVV
jgi:hypothetical protein